jgi:hypothetical protein
MLAVDNVLPEKSRLKLYFQTPHTSFTSVREIMTLGGRISAPESQLEDLRTLLLAVSGLVPDFPNEQEIPCCKKYSDKDVILDPRILLSGYVYYFDLAPGPEVPQINFTILCVVTARMIERLPRASRNGWLLTVAASTVGGISACWRTLPRTEGWRTGKGGRFMLVVRSRRVVILTSPAT